MFRVERLGQGEGGDRLLDQARQLRVRLFGSQTVLVDPPRKEPIARDDQWGDRKGGACQVCASRYEDRRHRHKAHPRDNRSDHQVHDAPRARHVGGQTVGRVSLLAAFVVRQSETLELGEQVVAHARRASVLQMRADHHTGHPHRVADDLQRCSHQDQADDLPWPSSRATRG